MNAWRETFANPEMAQKDLVTLAWTDTRAHYRIPSLYAEQLIDGVARDVYQTRYESFDEIELGNRLSHDLSLGGAIEFALLFIPIWMS